MIKKVVFLTAALGLSVKGFAQDQARVIQMKRDSSSVPKKVVSYAADKFTIIRPLNIEFTNVSPYTFSPKKGLSAPKEGKVDAFRQVKVTATLPFIKKKHLVFGGTVGYKFTGMTANLFESFTSNPTAKQTNFHNLFTSLNVVYFSTLGGNRAVYSASLIVDGSDKYVERVKGLASGVVILKSNAKTIMSVGVALNLDPTTQLPVLPVFTYEYKFDNGLVFDLTLPKSMYVRKNVFRSSRLSLGSEMDVTSFYLYNLEDAKQRFEYRQIDVNSGFIYEHAFGDFVLTGKAGLKVTPSSRIFEKEKSFNRATVAFKPNPTFYFNVGVSFNPFTLLKKKQET
ncbi:hypothetical protein ACPDHL_08690 [Myroides sp. C15-4]|uniref:hypothetical protein n=1 Tax=Myroides sp. C15-4 TaxID=3400532 RepID=UPI003D2F7516